MDEVQQKYIIELVCSATKDGRMVWSELYSDGCTYTSDYNGESWEVNCCGAGKHYFEWNGSRYYLPKTKIDDICNAIAYQKRKMVNQPILGAMIVASLCKEES